MALGKYNLNVTLALAVAVAVVTLVLFAPNAKAQSQKQDQTVFCIVAEDREFCETLVEGTKTAIEATARAIKISIVIAKKLEPYVHKFIASLDIPPESKNSVLNTCNQDYQKAIDNFSAALNDLNKGDKAGITTKLSTPTMTNCVAKLDHLNISAPVVKKAKQELDKYAQTTALVAKNA